MKKLFKFILILLLLVLLAVAAFVYTFDANKYKKEVAEIVGIIIGQPVSIKGNVDISVYPWIGIKLNDMVIKNNSGFSRKNFATIGQFDISVKIMPLLEKRLDIDKLVMHRLVIDFEKNAVGENNWSAFSGSDGVESKYGLA
ncbi:MAG: AsmA family protein, partial [Gammaproteobacteria bacterium]|nr:AsmA family protein [Gammaproteobacteria bacterium]